MICIECKTTITRTEASLYVGRCKECWPRFKKFTKIDYQKIEERFIKKALLYRAERSEEINE